MTRIGVFTKTHPNVYRVDALSTLALGINRLALWVDQAHVGMTQDRVRKAVEDGHARFEVLGPDAVVVGSPAEVLAPRQLKRPVEVRRRSYVRIEAEVANARIPIGEATADGLGPIRRSVVADHQLKIRKRLGKVALDCLDEVVVAVEHG